jgi:hypothetical protein
MVVVALIEVLVPLHARGHWNRYHLRPSTHSASLV